MLVERLAHPGVVRFIELVDTDEGGKALHTEFVSSDTWATRPITDPAKRAKAMAALAGIVADLHDRGVAHRRLVASHVLHGDEDDPVLCSFSRAADADEVNKHVDLIGLAELCHDTSLPRGAIESKLEALAESARSGEISARDLKRQLDAIQANRSSRTERRPNNRPPPLPKAPRRKPRLLLVAPAAVGVLAVVLAVGWWLGRDHLPTDGNPESNQTAVSQSTSTPGLGDQQSGGASNHQPAQGATSSGTVVEHNGNVYSIGGSGDRVVVGDWNCDSQPTPALLRPSTGEVVIFESWPERGETLAMPVLSKVPEAFEIEVLNGGSCDLLRVRTPGGDRLLDPKRSG